MQILENGIQVPTNGDTYNLTDDLATMGDTVRTVVPVGSLTQRNALTVSAGSVVSRTDLSSAPLETYDGSGWSVSDVEWTNVPLAQGFDHFNSSGWSGIKYAVRNGWVIVNGAVYRADAWGDDTTCTVIPAAFKPAVKIQGSNGCNVEPTVGNITLGAGVGAKSFSATWPLF